MVAQSVTNKQIARYWNQRRRLEEDHLFAAVKAAARLRAQNLSEDDYLRFKESLAVVEEEKSKSAVAKDWWTKSKYAYLNQPAADHPRRRTDHFHLLPPQYSFTFKSASLLKSISPAT
ncbi:hypothetical protein SASPL_134487 [Salvia splendens]|uniref:Uncharacterized protein n=1 Tax=Salvia splendens TaxID=180675 RepID=A0A8X8X366_SALSN|nr:uncharacterized protein LOC121758945 [Salvia splendens]KAG6406875.1 hypothetical protein SASPL_134487 [Salvia splendens]